MNFRLLLILPFLFLIGCATVPTEQPSYLSWSAWQQKLSALTSWRINGSIGIQRGNEGESASFRWQQAVENYDIYLFGPLGLGAIRLQGSNQVVTLQTSKQTYRSSSAESLLVQVTGWQIPVSNLVYWIRGVPAPAYTSSKTLDEYQRLKVLRQQGWEISYSDYSSTQGLDLPHKVELIRDDLKIRIAIKTWDL